MQVKRGAARTTPPVKNFNRPWGSNEGRLTYLDFQPNSLSLRGEEIQFAGKAMSNGKSELWEQSGRKVAFNAHTGKLASKAVLTSQNDDLGGCIHNMHTSRDVPDTHSPLESRHLLQRGRELVLHCSGLTTQSS
jgi:hypothetical protein